MRMIRRLGLFALGVGWGAGLAAQPVVPLQNDYADAILRDWVQPEYPAAARAAQLEGRVVVEFVAEADGHVSRSSVTKSTDERFNASALAAVQRWVFFPGKTAGRPVACGMRTSVRFKLEQLQQAAVPLQPPIAEYPEALPVTPPQLAVAPDPEYPPELRKRSLTGKVELEFSVESDGTASAPRVLSAPHAAFVGEALRALEKYRFEPAHQGPLPVKFPTSQGEMEFDSEGVAPADRLATNHLTVVEPEQFRTLPQPLVLPDPVYPRELLAAGVAGSATVDFTVTEKGAMAEIWLDNATRPEFGAALVAAVEAWRFEPARIVSQPAAAKLVVTYKFAPPVDNAEARLLLALQPGGAGIGGAGGLDRKIRPVWRPQPVYPHGLLAEKPAGQAMIEFIIDREGRARLPRVVSASREEFGWAAATAISQWVFAPPVRAGQPTDINVSIPIEFAPPKG